MKVDSMSDTTESTMIAFVFTLAIVTAGFLQCSSADAPPKIPEGFDGMYTEAEAAERKEEYYRHWEQDAIEQSQKSESAPSLLGLSADDGDDGKYWWNDWETYKREKIIEPYLSEGPTTNEVLGTLVDTFPELAREARRRFRALPEGAPAFPDDNSDVPDEMFEQWLQSGEVRWAFKLYGQNVSRWRGGQDGGPLPGPRFEIQHWSPAELLHKVASGELEREVGLSMTVIWLRNHL